MNISVLTEKIKNMDKKFLNYVYMHIPILFGSLWTYAAQEKHETDVRYKPNNLLKIF